MKLFVTHLTAVWSRLLLMAILSFMMIGLVGCHSARNLAPSPAFLYDTVYQNRVRHDSIYVDHFIEVNKMGDSIFKYEVTYRWAYRYVHDTVLKVEEIPVEVPVLEVREVEKQLSWWQEMLIRLGYVGLFGLLGLFGYMAFKVWRRG